MSADPRRVIDELTHPGRSLSRRAGIAPECLPARPGRPDRGGDPLRQPPVPRAPATMERDRTRNPERPAGVPDIMACRDAETRQSIWRQNGLLERNGGGHRSAAGRAERGGVRRIHWRQPAARPHRAVPASLDGRVRSAISLFAFALAVRLNISSSRSLNWSSAVCMASSAAIRFFPACTARIVSSNSVCALDFSK